MVAADWRRRTPGKQRRFIATEYLKTKASRSDKRAVKYENYEKDVGSTVDDGSDS